MADPLDVSCRKGVGDQDFSLWDLEMTRSCALLRLASPLTGPLDKVSRWGRAQRVHGTSYYSIQC